MGAHHLVDAMEELEAKTPIFIASSTSAKESARNLNRRPYMTTNMVTYLRMWYLLLRWMVWAVLLLRKYRWRRVHANKAVPSKDITRFRIPQERAATMMTSAMAPAVKLGEVSGGFCAGRYVALELVWVLLMASRWL